MRYKREVIQSKRGIYCLFRFFFHYHGPWTGGTQGTQGIQKRTVFTFKNKKRKTGYASRLMVTTSHPHSPISTRTWAKREVATARQPLLSVLSWFFTALYDYRPCVIFPQFLLSNPFPRFPFSWMDEAQVKRE